MRKRQRKKNDKKFRARLERELEDIASGKVKYGELGYRWNEYPVLQIGNVKFF